MSLGVVETISLALTAALVVSHSLLWLAVAAMKEATDTILDHLYERERQDSAENAVEDLNDRLTQIQKTKFSYMSTSSSNKKI